MTYLDHIDACNHHDLSNYRPFEVDGVTVGYVSFALVERLQAFPEVFSIGETVVSFEASYTDFESRSRAIATVVASLSGEGSLPPIRGEIYPVALNFTDTPYFQLDRGAIAAFGVRAFGVHVNGFVRNPDGSIDMWIARRAGDRMAYPDMLDNIVAGGQPIGLGLLENVVKECGEEAGIPPELAGTATSTGAISYVYDADDGLKPDMMFCYDLELPGDFQPRNTDGEVAAFYRMPLSEVAEIVETSFDFKFNCSLVIIDFLIRHGFIPPEHPDYLALIQGLRR